MDGEVAGLGGCVVSRALGDALHPAGDADPGVSGALKAGGGDCQGRPAVGQEVLGVARHCAEAEHGRPGGHVVGEAHHGASGETVAVCGAGQGGQDAVAGEAE